MLGTNGGQIDEGTKMDISLHGLREIRGHKVLMVWMIGFEVLAIALRVMTFMKMSIFSVSIG